MFEQKKEKRQFIYGLITGALIILILAAVYFLGVYSSGRLSVAANNDNVNGGDLVDDTAGQKPTADVSKVSVGKDDNVRGSSNPKLDIIVFDDFECPYCARFAPTMDQVMAEYGDQVRHVFKNFPLSFHANAQKAAEAAECAADQGKFWEMHDALFALNKAGTMSVTNYKTKAVELGLNANKFNSCLDNGDMAAKVKADYQEGLAAGVSGTPGSFVGDQFVPGAISYAQIKSIIDSQL